MSRYAILGSTRNCGTALIENVLDSSMTEIHAFCRNREKLERLVPRVTSDARVKIFVGAIGDTETLAACLHGCNAVFLCITTNDNIPGCRVAQDTALGVVKVLERSRADGFLPMPKLVLLSSATIDDVLSRNTPWVLRSILLKSASHVYEDLRKTETLLRAEQDWLTTIFIKPGALSIDIQRGHALSLTDEDSPVSYLDLAAAMIEAVNDPQGRYDMRNVGVVNTHGRAKFPSGTPLCIAVGLLSHFAAFLHPYLPSGTGPR